MLKEISLGLATALMIFAFVAGYDILPLVVLGLAGGALYFIADTKGLLKNFDIGTSNSSAAKITFEDIGGQDTAVKELRECLDFINYEDRVKKLGIRPLKGILLTGPPGTGKTLLAKAAASYTDSVFLACSGSEFVQIYAGAGAQRVRKLFSSAREKAKKKNKSSAIIFVDEVEVLGARRGQNSNHMEYDQTLNELLVQMDGLKVDDSVRILVIAATNRADMLDPALMRPGRFDRQVKVDLPDRQGRYEILKIHARNKPLAGEVDLNVIAKETFGFSGAHLESLTNEAAILAMRENCDQIYYRHLHEAIDKVIMGEKMEKRPGKEELYRVAVHETGHALASEMVRPGSVSALTVTPRGGALGYMRQHHEEDHYLYTREHLENQIAVMLAGAVAEEMVMGNRSTGAANDFEKAFQTAEKIIRSGLSDLGIVSWDSLSQEQKYNEIKNILDNQEKKAAEHLNKMRLVIDDTVNKLLEQEKVTGEEFRMIIKKNIA
ncbi:vesicle-fusing ATPase [Desulfohalotomaculum tongense]|uniref:AAA family ATPase n=1 Tax=Desulforadius tongensis TaxID=1216062 RepID=UPI001959CF9D|nr:vesicle-fusing ATPase [Desulforadius tongensis]